jgi:type IV secretory pathway VirB3-like protein
VTRNQELGTFKLPVGATRPAVISGLNITYIWLIPVLGIPLLFVWVTRNIFWMSLGGPLLYVARRSNADPGLPRILWLWVISGSWLADRSNARGVEVVSATRPTDEADGVLHG